jgi:hypothetical protein
MEPTNKLINSKNAYCLSKEGAIYAAYIYHSNGQTTLDLRNVKGTFSVHWFDPLTGGSLQPGSIETFSGGSKVSLGIPPAKADKTSSDWVVLIKRNDE